MFPYSNIKVRISIAAPLNFDVPHLRVPRPRILMGSRPPPPRQAEATIRDYLKKMKPRAIRTGCEPSEMWEFAMCVFQQAYLPRRFGVKGNLVLDVMATLDRAKMMLPTPLDNSWGVRYYGMYQPRYHKVRGSSELNGQLSFIVNRFARPIL